jgi:integrase
MQGQILLAKFHPRSRVDGLQGASIKVSAAVIQYESSRTWKGKGRNASRVAFDSEFGHRHLVHLATTGKVEIESWLLKKRRELNWAKVNMHRYFEYVNAFFNWVGPKGKGWVQVNPCSTITSMGNGKARKRNTRITPDQEQALLKTAHQQEPFMLWLLYGALDLGVRRGEHLQIRVKDVNYQTWTISLPNPKADEPQNVYPETLRLRSILEQRRFLGPEAFVFGNFDGTAINHTAFHKAWHKWFRDAGLPVGRKEGLVWYDLRHEFVSHLLDMNVPIHVVRELARHKDISTTMGYVTASQERLRAGAAKMAVGRDGTDR